MIRRTWTTAALAGLLTLAAATYLFTQAHSQRSELADAPAPEHISLGPPVRDFTLRDHRGQPHSLSDLADRKLVVVVFLGTACPLAQLYGPRLTELHREFSPHGVAFLAVNANAQETLADLAAYVRAQHLPFPFLKDPDGATADAFAAVRTPEAFVLDSERRVRYRGRIDDQYSVGVRRPQSTHRDLALALEELIAGRVVSQPVTTASGCLIGRAPAVAPCGEITFAAHIQPILMRRCVACHRQGEIGPFPLNTYHDVVGWAPMIREVVEEGRMPPWFADPGHGTFRNNARLSVEEKQLLFRWIDNGCPEGKSGELTARPPFAEGWSIPRPDQIVYLADKPVAVPAEGDVEYQYFVVDPGFTEEKYIQAAEVRPGNRAVVHHALVLLRRPGSSEVDVDALGALLDFAPGMGPTVFPEGVALHVPAGSKFVFQMHYTPNGTPQEDRSHLGLVFADPAKVKKRASGGAVLNSALAIPAGAANHRVTAEHEVQDDQLLLSLSPHMHLRGKSFRVEAVFPDGRREILLDVPRYDFNWQLRYELAEPKRLPRGTRLVCTACYDNSASNPYNPDPRRTVRWGDQTNDEMLIGFFATVPAD